jgi:chemotaxis protein CheD
MTALKTWVIPPPKKTLVVGVADMAASNDASVEIATYSLGSCLGVAIYDPVSKSGGLLHLMLPDSRIDEVKATKSPYMFVDTGVPRLFQAVCNLGADRRRLVIKVAGGAQFLDPGGIFNIGERNQRALTQILERNSYHIHSQDTGGVSSRTVRLDLATGTFSVRCPGVAPYSI